MCSLLALACVAPNPGYDPDDGSPAEATADSSTETSSSPASSDAGLTSAADGAMTMGGTTGTMPPVDSGSTTDEPGSTSAEATTAGMPVEHVFNPFLGDCVHPPEPDPDACTAITDPGYIQVDANEADLGGVVVGYIAFEISEAFEAADVQSVLLRMVAHPFDPGSPTAEIWEVESFTHESLFMVAPAQIGAGPVGPSPGTVPESLIVEFSLPPSLIVPGQPLYLGIYTDSGDGVDYADEDSATPPELIVTAL